MTKKDHNGDGLIDIDTDEAVVHLNALRAKGVDFGTAWATSDGKIKSPGQIGQGPMGEAFMKNYREAADSLATAARQVPGHYGTLADNGKSAVDGYLDGEAAATRPFQ
ncbi:hypothetical protein [Alloactinosynnema sp. L-07]|uniref:hypothetical protein n=1 Tax=Alloactinosynnema sp. L-07 TaxID=1653480 RepID=UPI00065EF1EB|nr:hypothetical protein [Alloactinosynnema sp. L-07]CRK58756.1 hypothetical protein [Alloactinosynnema sp. L-07]